MSKKKNWIAKKKEATRDSLKFQLLEHGDLYCAAYVIKIEGLQKPYRFNNTVWATNEDEGLTQIKDNVRAIAEDIRLQHRLPEIARVKATMEAGGLVRRMCHCEEKEDGSWQAISINGTVAFGDNEEAARLALVYITLNNMIQKSRVRKALEASLEKAKGIK